MAIQVRLTDQLQKDIDDRLDYIKHISSPYTKVDRTSVVRKSVEKLIEEVDNHKNEIYSFPMNFKLNENELRALKSYLEKQILSLDDNEKEQAYISAHLMMIHQQVVLILNRIF